MEKSTNQFHVGSSLIRFWQSEIARSLEAKPMKKALFPTNPPQDQTRFPSPVLEAREITSLTGLPPAVSMVGYKTVRHSGGPVVVRAFPACVNIGRNFFSPPPDELGSVSKSFCTGVDNFYIEAPF